MSHCWPYPRKASLLKSQPQKALKMHHTNMDGRQINVELTAGGTYQTLADAEVLLDTPCSQCHRSLAHTHHTHRRR